MYICVYICIYMYTCTDEYINACMYIYNTHDAHTHTHLNTHSRRWTGQGEVRRPRCRTFKAWGTNQEFCSLRNVVRCESTQVLRYSVSKCFEVLQYVLVYQYCTGSSLPGLQFRQTVWTSALAGHRQGTCKVPCTA